MKTRKIISFILAVAMVLSMTSMVFAGEEKKIYLAMGDSLALGVTEGQYAYFPDFVRVSGSSIDLVANELDMDLIPFVMGGMRVSELRALFETDYYPEYDYPRTSRWIAASAANDGLTFNQAGELLQNFTKDADLLTVQVGTTDYLYATVMDSFWYAEELLGLQTERSYSYEYNRDEIYEAEASNSYIPLSPVDEPYEVPIDIVNNGLKYTPENFDLETWFKAVEESYFGDEQYEDVYSVFKADYSTEDYINILIKLYEIMQDKGQTYVNSLLTYITDSIVGRLTQYETDYRYLIDDIRALNPDVVIGLISEPNPFKNVNLYEDIPLELVDVFNYAFDEISADLARMANDKNCFFVDCSDIAIASTYDAHTLVSYFIAEPDLAENDLCMRLHPTYEAYRITAERVVSNYNAWISGTYEKPVTSGIGNEIYNVRNEIKNMFGLDLYQFNLADFKINFDYINSNLMKAATKNTAGTFGADNAVWIGGSEAMSVAFDVFSNIADFVGDVYNYLNKSFLNPLPNLENSGAILITTIK